MEKMIPIYLSHLKFAKLFINYPKLKYLYFIDFFISLYYSRNSLNCKSILKLLSINQYFYHHFFDKFELLFDDLYFPYKNLIIPLINIKKHLFSLNTQVKIKIQYQTCTF
jgi:hypothetical protein